MEGVILPCRHLRRPVDLIIGILLMTAIDVPTRWVSAQSDCVRCMKPLDQFGNTLYYMRPLLEDGGARFNQSITAVTDVTTCLKRCQRRGPLTDLMTDFNKALNYIQEHRSVIDVNAACLTSVWLDEMDNCWKRATTLTEYSLFVTSCRTAREAFQCLRLRVCPPVGGSQSSSDIGRVAAELFQVMTKSARESLNCSEDDAAAAAADDDDDDEEDDDEDDEDEDEDSSGGNENNDKKDAKTALQHRSGSSQVTRTDGVTLLLLIVAATLAVFPDQ